MNYEQIYLKYKQKYLSLKKGGDPCNNMLDAIKQVVNDNSTDNSIKIQFIKALFTPLPNSNPNVRKISPSLQRVLLAPTPAFPPPQPFPKQPVQPKQPIQPIQPIQPNKGLGLPIEDEIELYIPTRGGDSSNIWPIITNKWKKNKRLGIKGKVVPTLNFVIIEKNHNKNDEPILGRGTFTAVYQISNAYDTLDTTKYILRIYERNVDLFTKHYMYNPKIIEEYTKYKNYLIRIFYFGQLKTTFSKFRYIADKDNSDNDNYILSKGNKEYVFDYAITKIYNTATFDENNIVNNLTNYYKFKFLYNNIVFLKKLADNNEFHADYKIANIGWDDVSTLNVIMIDYDDETIQKALPTNKKLNDDSRGYITYQTYSSTYIPEYLKDENDNLLPKYTADKFIKYSVGGLYYIMAHLDIKYNQSSVKIPTNLNTIISKHINTLDMKNLGDSLHLNHKNYNMIPTYDEILSILDYIRASGYVS